MLRKIIMPGLGKGNATIEGQPVRLKHFSDGVVKILFQLFCSSSFTSLCLAENATSFCPSSVR